MKPITITLQQIKDSNPCGIFEDVLNHFGGENADMRREHPLVDGINLFGFCSVLWALRCLPEHDGLFLRYAKWCAYRIVDPVARSDWIAICDDPKHTAGEVARAVAISAINRSSDYVSENRALSAKLREILTAGEWV